VGVGDADVGDADGVTAAGVTTDVTCDDELAG
jgi:hypothetical protein